MKKLSLKNWTKVFSYTFKNIVRQKTYSVVSRLLAILFLLLPAVIMPIVQIYSDYDTVYSCNANEIIVVMTDAFTNPLEERYLLEAAYMDARFPDMSNLTYSTVSTLEEAGEKGKANDRSIILYVQKENFYSFNILLPEGSTLTNEDTSNYDSFLEVYHPFLFVPESSMSIYEIANLFLPIMDLEADEEDSMESIVEVLKIAIPYVIIMVLYFLVLFYVQNISGSVLLEKTSKLVDTMLLSVPPESMILGKIVAGALAAIMQFSLWLVSLLGGFAIGTALTKYINPETEMGLIQFIDSLDMFSGMFSISSVILAIVIILLGFYTYCGLAAIAGALASKQEDLASTQSICALTLVFSFILCLTGIMNEGGTALWMDYVPFTAILIMPGKLLLAEATVTDGLISAAILAATCLVFTIVAGKIYRALVFYRGNLMKAKDVVKIILDKQN